MRFLSFCQVNNLVLEVLILKQLKVPLKSTLMKKAGRGGLLWLTTHPMRMRILSERSESKDLS
jgi:hypothetical protein